MSGEANMFSKINGIKIVMRLQFEGECVMIDIVGNV